jgi:hypothetical protein
MNYKFTSIFKEHKDPEINTLIHSLKGEFIKLQNSVKGSNTTTQVYINSGGVTAKSSPDRIRIPKIDLPVLATGTTINFITDCSPAEAYPHNSYLVLSPICWRVEGNDKIDITCEFTDLTSIGFKATPAEDGFLRFQTIII